MVTIAYLCNQFPSPVEPYVIDEIGELRARGVRVIAGSAIDVGGKNNTSTPEIVLRPLRAVTVLEGLWLCVTSWRLIAPLVWRILFRGAEGPVQRFKALVHTMWGACYAVRLQDFAIDHIHVHHGFSASWIGMVAARLLGIEFSMTLHGSDLLIYRTYLDVKLKMCAFCVTVSEYNKRFLLTKFPEIHSDKIVLARLGVDIPRRVGPRISQSRERNKPFRILAVGRLSAVKDHAFLVQACGELRARGVRFECEIAGEGPERRVLESMIRKFQLGDRVHLLGHANRDRLDSLYGLADLVVLTSRSEGIPLVLMEAMALGKLVLAPAITGIPELVIPGQTGLLYEPGSSEDFLCKLIRVRSCLVGQGDGPAEPGTTEGEFSAEKMQWIRHAARVYVRQNFNRTKNLKALTDLFLRRVSARIEEIPHESVVLQQI